MKSKYQLSAINLGLIAAAYAEVAAATAVQTPTEQPLRMAMAFGNLASTLHTCYPKHRPQFDSLGLSDFLALAAEIIPKIVADNVGQMAQFNTAAAQFGKALSEVTESAGE